MLAEYRIVRETDKNGKPAFDIDGDPVFNLERKTKFGKWRHLKWSWRKEFLIESAERRFKQQKATEFILIDCTQKELSIKDGKVIVVEG